MNRDNNFVLSILILGVILLLDPNIIPVWILLIGVCLKWISDPGANALRNTNSTIQTAISTCYCAELVQDIADLAENLAPSPTYLKAGRQAAQCVFKQLTQNGNIFNLKIGKTKITGSIGKDTGISYNHPITGYEKNPDFDVVVFLNERVPPFENEIEWIADLIQDIPNVKDVSTKEISIKFVYHDDNEGEIKFDLLPAWNSVTNTHEISDVAHTASQVALLDISGKQKKALRQQKKINKDENRLVSSSFSESAVSYVKNSVEDDYVLKVVRLAKFWNSNIISSKYIPARSCMIELIAIEAQIGKGRGCLISGFRRFLDSMQNFGNLQVTIGATNNHNNEAFLRSISTNGTAMIPPIVLDPSNPYNNLADGLGSDTIRMFQTQARKTLSALEELKGRDGYKSVQDAIDHIFCNKE